MFSEPLLRDLFIFRKSYKLQSTFLYEVELTFCVFSSPQKLQLFQDQMEEIDARLVEAEKVKASWTPVQDLVIDSLSEQMDDLKVNIRVVSLLYLLLVAPSC